MYTTTIAGIIIVLAALLGINVTRFRATQKVGFGEKGSDAFIHAQRAHGNLMEHAPIVLILLMLVEAANVHSTFLAIVASAFVIFRFSHALGMLKGGKLPLIVFGAGGTYLIELLLGGTAVYFGIMSLLG